MSDIQVILSSSLARFTGGVRKFSVPGGTVRQVMERVSELYPSLSGRVVDEHLEPMPFVRIYVGDEDVRDLGSIDSVIAPDATVSILTAVAGG
ncbi:molybdopterin converting factor small subunit [Saccharothrix tamanrassetensis]|uniref:Molybdopterin converting factor small subunit n=1 Tax=Saccharothrix tamanrassetensis TaxID=1051531 RepID=A0A841CR31_9PSEU|nr:MoaD/ThiS family protein [Saccharothrix tamanrassetensis]MBB5958445.1 molybdopterin converting factor small subunit [Saccharothrix tamanrassetensis]